MKIVIMNAEKRRVFAHKKGAQRAIKRDIAAHKEKHGDALKIRNVCVTHEPDGRFGVLIKTEVESCVDYEELSGYSVELKSKKPSEVNVTPTPPLRPARFGSKQQMVIEMLARGTTYEALQNVCVKRDGSCWTRRAIYALLYYDIKMKGYGIRTEWRGNDAVYFLVLPDGYEKHLEPRMAGKK